MKRLRLIFLFLLSVVTTLGVGSGQTSSEWSRNPDPTSFVTELRQKKDVELARRIAAFQANRSDKNRDAVKHWLEAREVSGSLKPIASDVTLAKSVKRNPLYRDRGTAEESNWIAQALARLGRFEMPQPDIQGPQFTGFGVGSWFIPAMWTILGLLVAFFAYHVFKHVELRRRIKRRSEAMLEDDEPERSVDEWLAQSDELARAGEYRQAVRCLFIACLIRLDEFRVARFDRRQTNWEHLYRIEASERYPVQLGFRPITERFDRVWYGHEPTGDADLDLVKNVYAEILAHFQGEKT